LLLNARKLFSHDEKLLSKINEFRILPHTAAGEQENKKTSSPIIQGRGAIARRGTTQLSTFPPQPEGKSTLLPPLTVRTVFRYTATA
jgi:hypothetical protein